MEYTEAIRSSQVVLVEFYATWCIHCQHMMPIVEQIKEKLKGTVNIYQVDIDNNRQLAEAENIDATPTFIIYKDSNRVWRNSGEMEKSKLLNKIESYM